MSRLTLTLDWPLAYEFACNSKACAPPPVGSGGSDDGGHTYTAPRPGSSSDRIGDIEVYGQPLTHSLLHSANNYFLTVANPMTFSGHKAHIYADDLDGVHSILMRIKDDIDAYGWGAKVATQKFMEYTEGGHKQRGKGVTIYFPRKATWEAEMKIIVNAMSTLPKRQHKEIQGDEPMGNGVGHRFELKDGAPDRDLHPSEYMDWYQAA